MKNVQKTIDIIHSYERRYCFEQAYILLGKTCFTETDEYATCSNKISDRAEVILTTVSPANR